ncbi:MAG: hypothetical protein CMH75_06190 [Nitrospina sp.]|nr:hypothetical protein [Nitrospina sp.]
MQEQKKEGSRQKILKEVTKKKIQKRLQKRFNKFALYMEKIEKLHNEVCLLCLLFIFQVS